MIADISIHLIDITVFIIANLINISMTVIFIFREKGWGRGEYITGLVLIVLILPLSFIIFFNVVSARDWWTIVIPAVVISFLAAELLLDYIMGLEFRNTPLLWPYIILYYLALFGMIGYSFSIGKGWGLVTLCTYFLNLFATWYAHRKPNNVNHG